MANSLFATQKQENDWVYTPNQGALRCVPPAPLSRLAGYALAVDRNWYIDEVGDAISWAFCCWIGRGGGTGEIVSFVRQACGRRPFVFLIAWRSQQARSKTACSEVYANHGLSRVGTTPSRSGGGLWPAAAVETLARGAMVK
jgi:hypothetical protein